MDEDQYSDECNDCRAVDAKCMICQDEYTTPPCPDCGGPLFELCPVCEPLADTINFHAWGLSDNSTRFYQGLIAWAIRQRDEEIQQAKEEHRHQNKMQRPDPRPKPEVKPPEPPGPTLKVVEPPAPEPPRPPSDEAPK